MRLALGVLIAVILMGCSTSIDKDTKLSLTGPRAKVTRTF